MNRCHSNMLQGTVELSFPMISPTLFYRWCNQPRTGLWFWCTDKGCDQFTDLLQSCYVVFNKIYDQRSIYYCNWVVQMKTTTNCIHAQRLHVCFTHYFEIASISEANTRVQDAWSKQYLIIDRYSMSNELEPFDSYCRQNFPIRSDGVKLWTYRRKFWFYSLLMEI